MSARSRMTTTLLLSTGLVLLSSCASFWHELQPHRLRRWNRQPMPYRHDPEFSSHAPGTGSQEIGVEYAIDRSPERTWALTSSR